MYPNARPRLALAASLIALLGTIPGLAAADPYVSASASITDLRYRLIDLDPTDGIAPSATLNGSGTLHVVSSLTNGAPEIDVTAPVSGLGLPFHIASQTGLGYGASIAGGSLSALANTAAGNGPVLVNQFPGSSTGYGQDLYVYEERVSRSGEVQLGIPGVYGYTPTFTIELGANTGIVFEGTASTSVLASTQAYDAFIAAVQADIGPVTPLQYTSHGYLSSAASVEISLHNLRPHEGGFTSHNTTFSLASSFSEAVGPEQSSTSRENLTENFLVDYWNLGSNSTTLSFSLNTRATALAAMQGTFAMPVPEPGTWALMGLGLAGVAVARRRQRA